MESILGVLAAISVLLFSYYSYKLFAKINSTKEIQTSSNTVVEVVEPTPVAVQPEPVQVEVAEKPKKTRKPATKKAEKIAPNVVALPTKAKKPVKKKSEKGSNKA